VFGGSAQRQHQHRYRCSARRGFAGGRCCLLLLARLRWREWCEAFENMGRLGVAGCLSCKPYGASFYVVWVGVCGRVGGECEVQYIPYRFAAKQAVLVILHTCVCGAWLMSACSALFSLWSMRSRRTVWVGLKDAVNDVSAGVCSRMDALRAVRLLCLCCAQEWLCCAELCSPQSITCSCSAGMCAGPFGLQQPNTVLSG
jgi:hypothetical protein